MKSSLDRGAAILSLRSTEVAPKWAFLIFLLEEVLFTFNLATVEGRRANG
jgi:hypothetical protein